MRKQLRLSGSGGQGVITAAIIFAEAAVEEGKEAVQSQNYRKSDCSVELID